MKIIFFIFYLPDHGSEGEIGFPFDWSEKKQKLKIKINEDFFS